MNFSGRRWISIRECSTYLSLHEQSVYRLVNKGVIPASRIGRNVRVDLKKLDEILESREKINGA